MKKTQRWLCLLLVLCMMVSVLPVTAAGAEALADVIIEAESCEQTTDKSSWTGGEYTKLKVANQAAGHGQFTFVQTMAMNRQSVSFTLAPAAGTYEIYVTSKDNPDRAIFQFSLGGTNIGDPVDQYNANTSGVFVEHKIGTATFSGEVMQLTATLTGRNAANTTRYGGTFDYFRLVPVSGGTQEPANQVLYAENFDTAMPDGLGDGWERVKLKNGYGLQGTSAAGAGLLTALPSGELPEEYTIVADMALMQSLNDSGYSAGVTFQHKDAKNFYHFRLDNGTGIHAQLYQWANGICNKKIVSETGYPTTETNGEARRLRVTVSADEINCYIDGQLAATYAKGAAGGTVGLRVYNAAALFDNVTVYSGVVGPEENERANPFEFEEAATVWNNEDETYQESTGTWSDVTGKGWNDSDARTAESGSVGWSSYPPETGNFKLEYNLPAADCAAINITVQTLNGMWKYTIPAGTASGWHLLGVVSATAGTAFTLTAESSGRIYADAVRLTATRQAADAVYTPTGGGSEEPAILVNQIGYDNGTAMRASCPNVAGGTEFRIVNVETNAVVKTGTVENGIADFTGLETQADTDFYLTCAGKQSYTFTVGTNLIQRRSVKNALAFMSETRSDGFKRGGGSGNAGNGSGVGWRDSHQFSFELNGLVLQYMANPSVYDNMPHSIVGLDSCDYADLQTQNEPDIVWLIKFAARRYYDVGTKMGQKLHMLLKEQLAYYLYLAPELIARGWESAEFYQKVRDYTISVWGENACNVQWYPVNGTNHDLYSVQNVFGGLKGSQPMGHSIVPNLMMYEVAKRDGLGDETTNKFLKAAIENCKYTIGNDDGNDICDPFFCKGQRMSEYITIPALGYFIEMCPGHDALKAQVKAKIAEWAKVNIARGSNLWDIRMAVSKQAGDLTNYQFHNPNFTADQKKITKEYWTGAAYAAADKQGAITGDSQSGYLAGGAPKNEPGNQAGLQAVMYAAARVLEDDAVNTRLHELGVAAIDDLYGRNPSGRAAFYHFTRDFEGADLGWYKQYQGGFGLLGGCTAVIDANVPEAGYPYAPQNGNTGYTEGWVAYNTAWNASLAYSQAENVALSVDKTSGKVGDTVNVTLTAPIDMDTAKAETGTVWVTNETTGERMAVVVTEYGASSTTFKGSFKLPNAQSVMVSYGSGLFAHKETITVTDFTPTATAGLKLTADRTEAKTGETVKLALVFEPAGATDRIVDFVSSNEDVATVDANGNVTLLAAGKTTITAKLHANQNIAASVTLTVMEAQKERYDFDLRGLFDAKKYSYTGDKAPAAITDPSVGSASRVKLNGGTVTFQLGTVQAGTYKVTLHSKYVGTYSNWSYGIWSFQMNGQSVGTAVDFSDVNADIYQNREIGTVTLPSGETTFTFVSENGKPLVPVSLTLTRVGGETPEQPDEPLTPITKLDELYKKTYTDSTGSLNYRMYVPADYDKEKTYPVLIYLNGAGSRGTDNEKQLKNLSPLITPLIGDKEHECIMLVPQLPTSDKWVNVDWANGCYDASVEESKSAKLLMGLIGELKQKFSVNADRIYLMGQSFGGYGTWDLITRHPDTFAAAIPMAGAGCTARAAAVKDMPILVLHGKKDPTVPVSGSCDMVKAVKDAGSKSITYLEYAEDDHYVQRRVFEQPELWLDWLFAQSKDKATSADDTSDCYFPVVTVNALDAEQKNNFTVSGGTLAATSGGEGKLTLTPASGNSSILALWNKDKKLADGQLTVHLTMEALNGSGGAGLVFRAQDANNYIHVRFTKDGVQYLEFVGGTSKNTVMKPYTLTGNRITCMKAVLEGKHVKIYVDNVLLIERDIQTTALQKSGMIGLRSYAVPATADDLIWAEKDASAPSICLTSPAERQVIQRDLRTKAAEVTITGEVKNAEKVLVRVVGGEEVIADWTDAVVDAGVFTKTLNLPQGGWYTVEAKAVDANGAKLTSAQVERFGVGMNILCIGQSNMVGIGQGGTATVADDRVSNFMNETWSHLVDPYAKGDNAPNLKGQTCGNSMVPALANALVAAYNIPVGIIPAAMGGSNLLTSSGGYPHWLNRNEANLYDRSTLYGNSLYRAREAGGIELIVMNQGENNVSTSTTQEDYLNGMKRLLASYRKDLKNSSLPLFYCQLGPAKPGSWTAEAKDDVMDSIRAAQLLANDPENGLILAAMEMDLARNSDNLHYTTDSQKIIGARVANAIRWYYDQTADKADYYMGPRITGAQFADARSTMIDVTIAHTGGTDFAPASGITGFVVRDGAETIKVTDAARKDASTIRLTLEKVVSASAQLRYCKGLLPDVSGIVKDNSAMQLPLNITPDWLNVQSAEHRHTMEFHLAKASTETAEGNIAYWKCTGCGRMFTDEAGVNEVFNVTIPKLTPVIPVAPSEPAQLPFNPNAGSSVSKFPFADVPSDSWYYSSVKAAWENGLIDGVTVNEFKPNATLTVAQTIKLAAALHQLDRTGEVSLKNGGANWYDSYVSYAVTNDIIEKDYANYTKAQMNAPVTRGEFVHIFHGAEEAYKAINTVADNAIPDVKTTDKFALEIYEFYRAGILTGSDAKGTFHSASTIKRSEAAAILLRMFETSARKSITMN